MRRESPPDNRVSRRTYRARRVNARLTNNERPSASCGWAFIDRDGGQGVRGQSLFAVLGRAPGFPFLADDVAEDLDDAAPASLERRDVVGERLDLLVALLRTPLGELYAEDFAQLSARYSGAQGVGYDPRMPAPPPKG